MKKLKFIFCVLISFAFTSCEAQPVKLKESEFKEETKKISDTLIEYKSFYKNGQLKEKISYNNDYELNGNYIEWNEKGIKKAEWNYRKNKFNGEQITFDENGNVDVITSYLLGEKHGKSYTYDKGDTLSIETYDHGKLVDKWIPKDYYKPSAFLMKGLLDDGLDSTTAAYILNNNLSGYVVKNGDKVKFIEDPEVAGILNSVTEQANAISENKVKQPVTRKYLLSKGLTEKQIDELSKKGLIKIER